MMDARSERGQTLIQLALVFVVLLGVAALAIDIGHAYVVRRQMQNAADAGALAGAYALCKMQPKEDVIELAQEYMTRNNVDAADINAESVTIAGGVVNVRADASASSFLAGAFGFSIMDVAAESAAACAAANSTCNLWPITLDYAMWAEANCGETLIIWNSLNENKLDDSCVINGKDRPLCDCYKCDRNGDGKDDFRFVTEDSRAWLDFSGAFDPRYPDTINGNGCGASELKDRIEGGSSGRITLPTCIAGLNGVKASALKDIESGEVVRIPLYSSTGCPSSNKCGDETYYVEHFGCMMIVEADSKFTLNPKPEYSSKYKSLKNFMAIFATKACGDECTTSCGGTDGTMPEDWELRSVNIVK